MAPNPATVAGVAPWVPGTEKVTSVTWLPTALKVRFGRKVEEVCS